MKLDLANLRGEFKKSGLRRKSLDKNPIVQFSKWFDDVIKFEILQPNTMILATANSNEIGIRTVLLKYFDNDGFVFFTNYQSNKSLQIQQRPQASLLFSWLDLERQVKIFGKVEKISLADSNKYFSIRPKKSQIGALASKQSLVIPSREFLLDKFSSIEKEYFEKEIPPPDFWGGYRVIPDNIEFWQGAENRLHDRFIYQKTDKGWSINRLAP